jgi:hypothetical protein
MEMFGLSMMGPQRPNEVLFQLPLPVDTFTQIIPFFFTLPPGLTDVSGDGRNRLLQHRNQRRPLIAFDPAAGTHNHHRSNGLILIIQYRCSDGIHAYIDFLSREGNAFLPDFFQLKLKLLGISDRLFCKMLPLFF